jgi:hypothetical protein
MELLDNVHTRAINGVRSSGYAHLRTAERHAIAVLHRLHHSTYSIIAQLKRHHATMRTNCAVACGAAFTRRWSPAGGDFTADCDTPYRAIYATPCDGDECIVMPHMRTRSHCGISADARYCACLVCDDLSLDVCRETPDGDGCCLAPKRETQSTARTARALCDWGIDSSAPQRRRNTTDIWALGSR